MSNEERRTDIKKLRALIQRERASTGSARMSAEADTDILVSQLLLALKPARPNKPMGADEAAAHLDYLQNSATAGLCRDR